MFELIVYGKRAQTEGEALRKASKSKISFDWITFRNRTASQGLHDFSESRRVSKREMDSP